jgi:hypothetical protein
MEALLEHLALGDQPASVPNRAHQRLHRSLGDWPASALTRQPDQRRTISVVGLGAARAELGPGRLGL